MQSFFIVKPPKIVDFQSPEACGGEVFANLTVYITISKVLFIFKQHSPKILFRLLPVNSV